jgi:Ca2+-binding RTX toxin-like protein
VPQLKFKVGRSAGGNMFTIVGESGLVPPSANQLNSFATQIPVKTGDLIGFYNDTGNNGRCARSPAPGYSEHFKSGDVVPPTMTTFTPDAISFQLDVSAILEPDCDNDGLGDDTQDSNLSSCGAKPLTCRGQRLSISGTPGNDEIVGTSGGDVIAALGGTDKVRGLGGNDLICGGAGKDTLKGGPGMDRLYGQGAKDKLVGGGAKDKCVGGKASDKAKGCETVKSI